MAWSSWLGQDGITTREFGIRARTFTLVGRSTSAITITTDGAGTIGDAIGTTTGQNTTTTGTTHEAELITIGIVTTGAAAAAAMRHTAAKETELRIEVPANARTQTTTGTQTIRGLQTTTGLQTIKRRRLPDRLRGRHVRLEGTGMCEGKATHALEVPVITTTAEREAIRQEEGPASVAEALTGPGFPRCWWATSLIRRDGSGSRVATFACRGCASGSNSLGSLPRNRQGILFNLGAFLQERQTHGASQSARATGDKRQLVRESVLHAVLPLLYLLLCHNAGERNRSCPMPASDIRLK